MPRPLEDPERVQRSRHIGDRPPYSTTVAYAGPAPTLLSVSVPRGTRWDAFVVFSN